MIDTERMEMVLAVAKTMGLKPKQLTDYGLIAIEIDGQERYLFYDGSNPNSQLASWLSTNKHAARVIFERNGLPNIPFCLSTGAREFLAEHKKIVAKPIKGQHSKGIRIITNNHQLEELDLRDYLLEKYINGDEVRVLVLHGEVIAVHQKIYDGEINNPDTVRRVSLEKELWDRQLVQMAIKATVVLGLKFAVADFKVTAGGEAFILEVNSAPGLVWFQQPTEGPGIEATKLYLNEIIRNYKS